jgi:hypothetical protein
MILEPLSSYATSYRYPSPWASARAGRARTRCWSGSRPLRA